MEAYILDSLNLLIRWIHIITGIAWIGASFYFVMLDMSLRSPKKSDDVEKGVFGELWAVHGGGFYHSQKYLAGPLNEPLSDNLHWSKWEAYTTWMSGFALFILMYWYKAELYLIDPSVMDLSKSMAIGISLLFIVGGWFIYDFLCKSSLAKNDNVLAFIILILTTLLAWGLTQIFSGRGAFIMFGAVLGSIMVANVFFAIIPGQKQMVSCILAGKPVKIQPGIVGKQRSVHNTYFTLPVLFAMISNHYAGTYGHEYNWLILMGISLSGALIRVFFVSRHTAGEPNTKALYFGLFVLLLVFIAMAPKADNASVSAKAVEFQQVETIVMERCTVCHSITPTGYSFNAPPKGIVFDTAEQIKAQAASIIQQTVTTKAMPMGNLTAMTIEERDLLSAWFQTLNKGGQ